MNYLVTGTGFVSPEIKKLQGKKDIIFLSAKELASSTIVLSEKDKVYVPTEDALQSVLDKLDSTECRDMIATLKDKFACRQMLAPLYPNFYFEEVMLSNFSTMQLDKKKKYVVKPKRGFFNAGVRVFMGSDNLSVLQKDIAKELSKNAKYFSPSVLSTTELLVEEYIDGIEFAVDMFYSSEGKPVIVNIYQHPVPKYEAYFHVVYFSQKSFFDRYLEQFSKIFVQLNKRLQATSLPIHAEFKYIKGAFVPIEFNPLRYGGMGLADLTLYAYDFNPFLAFFEDREPDWTTIWQTRKDFFYAWVLGYNGTNVDITKQQPNHKKFQKILGDLLHYNKLDYQHMPVFANAYIKTDEKKIKELLTIDFNDYFEKKIAK